MQEAQEVLHKNGFGVLQIIHRLENQIAKKSLEMF